MAGWLRGEVLFADRVDCAVDTPMQRSLKLKLVSVGVYFSCNNAGSTVTVNIM